MEGKHVYSIGKSGMIIHSILSDKPKLFILVSVVVVSVLAIPMIIPY